MRICISYCQSESGNEIQDECNGYVYFLAGWRPYKVWAIANGGDILMSAVRVIQVMFVSNYDIISFPFPVFSRLRCHTHVLSLSRAT